MNIEEERKAFEKWVMSNSMQGIGPFEVWCAAKADAIEMAKTPAFIWDAPYSSEHWVNYKTDFEYRKGPFVSYAEAEAWIVANGFRVVEE